MENNIKKSFFWNTLGSGFAAINSLFFLIIVTRINGTKIAGIFTLCYATACLIYIIAVYSGRTYQVTEIDNKISDNDYIISRIVTCFMALLCTVIFALINHYHGIKIYVLFLLCLLRTLEALSDVFHGVLQKNSRLDLVGKSLFMRSLLNILLFLVIDYILKDLVIACLAMVLSNVLVLLFYDIRLSNRYRSKNKKIRFVNLKTIFLAGFYTFGFTFLSNYLINIPRYSIDHYLTESYQTIFGIIVMPGTFIILVSQFIIQPFIMKLKNLHELKKNKEYNSLVNKILISILLIGVLFIIGAYIFGIHILEFMYGINLKKYLISLLIVLTGTISYALCTVISASLVVLRKTKIQLIIYVISLVSGILISYLLVKMYSFIGGVFSYLIIMMILTALYIIYYLVVIKNKKNWDVITND